MKRVVFLVLLVAITVASSVAKPLDDELSENTGENRIRSTDKGTEQDFEIFDEQGNLLSTAELFLDEGYEVDKPENSTMCYVKLLTDTDQCYQARLIEDNVPATIADHCGDRSVAFLVPLDCEKAANSKGSRQKRWLNIPEVEGIEPDSGLPEHDCVWKTVVTDCRWVFKFLSNGRIGCFYECKESKILICDWN